MDESLMKLMEQARVLLRDNDVLRRAHTRLQVLEQELQREKDRVALMGDATLHNTRKSAEKTRISKDDPRWCKEYVMVCNVVDREINLQEKLKVIYDKQDKVYKTVALPMRELTPPVSTMQVYEENAELRERIRVLLAELEDARKSECALRATLSEIDGVLKMDELADRVEALEEVVFPVK